LAFLMASIGLGAILAIKGKLPPLRIFRKPRWLVLLPPLAAPSPQEPASLQSATLPNTSRW
jgi:hypothetical protein